MRFGILGPLLLADDSGAEIPVASGRLRVLMAALVVQANHVVTVDELAEVLWEGTPPAGGSRTVRRYVTRLRAATGPAARRIVTRAPGYLCEATGEEVDLLRFERLCAVGDAGARDQDWPRAAAVLSQALGLWRGSPLEDAESRILRDAWLPSLEQLRLQALEWRVEADLHLGLHVRLVPELTALTSEHPLREHFHAQLMLALYRGGRQAEALTAYHDARSVLVRELGVEPAARLRTLYQQILAADPELSVSPEQLSGIPAGADVAISVARQLPAAIAHFTGRAAALEALTDLARRVVAGPCATAIAAIGGAAGSGKTALAMHWGQRNAGLFPDGQLYVNLRGYDPAAVPLQPAAAIRGFLLALGVPAARVPSDQDTLAGLYRSLLAGRRVLIVLDNARDCDQVRPLLPGDGCMVLVTSRSELTGLAAVDGAHLLSLDLLPADEACDLLTSRIAADHPADPEAIGELAELCGRLPLALNIVAARALARPWVPLRTLAGQLRDSQGRLAALETGDEAASVRGVFSWSMRHLDGDAARTFRLAALHPGPDFDRYAIAALAGVTVRRARGLLDALGRVHLTHPQGTDRHGLHDLLRLYALELADAGDGQGEQRTALARLLDYYVQASAVAMDALFPIERHWRPRPRLRAAEVPPVAGPAAALAWLDAERANLVAVSQHAAEHGWPRHAIWLAAILARYLDTQGHYPEAAALHARAYQAARDTGDRRAAAAALADLGTAHRRLGRYRRAASCLRRAGLMLEEAGDQHGQARALHSLSVVDIGQGRFQEATDHLHRALALFRDTSDRVGEGRALGDLGRVSRRQGRYEHAAGMLRQALMLFREVGDQAGETHVLCNLGDLSRRQGRYDQAADWLHQALDLARKIGDHEAEAYILGILGLVSQRQGQRPDQAAGYLRQSLHIFSERADLTGQAHALNTLGEADRRWNRYRRAAAHHQRALALAQQVGDLPEQADARHGLASTCHAAGEPGLATRHWQRALDLYTSLGTPEADHVRAQLATLTAVGDPTRLGC